MTTGARQAGGRRAPAGDVDEGGDGAEQHDVEAHGGDGSAIDTTRKTASENG